MIRNFIEDACPVMKMLKFAIIVCLSAICLHSGLCNAKGEVACNLSEPAYFPHQNCSKFYVCDHGHLTELECPPSLHFNPELEVCDFPVNVPECVGGTREPDTSNPPPTPPISTTSETIPTTSTSTTQRTTTSTSTTPPTTTLLTTTRSTTVSYSSTPSTTAPSTTLPTTTAPTTPPITSAPTTPPPISSTPSMPNNCPASGTDKIPHPAFPDQYIICVNGVAYEVHCPDGLHFNPIKKECDFPQNENSTTTPEPPSTTPSPYFPQCPPEGTGSLPMPGNCSFYVFCAEGFGLVQKCVDGTCFNAEHSKCEPEADAGSPILPELDLSTDSICQDNKEDVMLYPSKNSCKLYHICFGITYKGRQECKKGKHFHYFTQNCIPKEFSDCKNV